VKSKLKSEWTPADVRRMRALAKAKKSAREAAEILGRSRGAVAFKAMKVGVSFHAIDQKRGTQSTPRQRRRLSSLAKRRARAA